MENQEKNDENILATVPVELHEKLYQVLKKKFESKNDFQKAVETFVNEKKNQKSELGGRAL